MKRKAIVVMLTALLALALPALLAACAAPTAKSAGEVGQSATTAPDMTRLDEQGMVEVAVRPLNLPDSGETLDFEVSMNTHSVDLSMDLATLATLSTDTSKTVQAVKWDGPRGGHHVSGKLSFPAQANGSALLEGAKRLTLTIRDVAAPERVFVWELRS